MGFVPMHYCKELADQQSSAFKGSAEIDKYLDANFGVRIQDSEQKKARNGIVHKGFFHKNGNSKYSKIAYNPQEKCPKTENRQMGNVRF
eukprot:2528600-Amphidinium_carterae.1